MEEYIDSVRGKKAIGRRIVYNPNKILEVHIIPRIDLYTWIMLLNRYKKKIIHIIHFKS